MCQMPAPTWTSYFCTGVSVGEETLLQRGTAAGICKHTAMPTHRRTGTQGRPVPGRSVGTSCPCHQACGPVIRRAGQSSSHWPRPLALNSEHTPRQGQATGEAGSRTVWPHSQTHSVSHGPWPQTGKSSPSLCANASSFVYSPVPQKGFTDAQQQQLLPIQPRLC